MRPSARLAISAFVASLFLGCNAPSADVVTYHKDIAPLLNAHCTSCHQDGGIAPFPLLSYDDVVAHKAAIAFSVRNRLMPPWNLDNSGDCQTYRDARWMSDDEIALLTGWLDAGAVEGEAPKNAPAPPAPDALGDGEGIVYVEMAEPYTPQPSDEHPNDDYRCFFLDPGLVDDAYVQGFEIFPGQPSEVHHMLLFSLLTEDAEIAATEMDAEDDGFGWTCFGAAGNRVDSDEILLVAGWAPGTNVMRYPEETGLFVPGQRRMVMQIHYNLLSGAVPDQTALKIAFKDEVAKEAALLPIVDDSFVLPPNDPAARFSFTTPLVGLRRNLELHGIFPHMHTLGRSLRFSMKPIGDTDGSDEICLGDVPQWDFHWQQVAFYDEPVIVDGSQQLDVTCAWDTTGRVDEVTWGEGTQDEMCLVFVYVTRQDGGPLAEAFP